ncbi:MAG: iron-only hydrogenase system regulator [Eubacteriales bacterium]|nr:iron-only hydrogenase system regulator [Eubacteriales bacterium]
MEETRVAVVAIVVENPAQADQLNEILHQYRQYIIGRMGIPYEKRDISLISIAVDAPTDIISAMSGKIGMLEGVAAKAVYSKV